LKAKNAIISEMSSNLSNLNYEKAGLKNKCDILENRVHELEETLYTLESENRSLKSNLAESENTYAVNMSKLKYQISDLQKENKE